MKILMCLLLVPVFLQAKVIESSRFDSLLNYLNRPNCLVISDIDNTILCSEVQLGSIAWGELYVKELEKKGIPPKEAQEVENILWRAIHQQIPIKTVDPDTARIVKKVQEQKIPIMGLTARAPRDAAYSRKQLEQLGIDLSLVQPINTGLQVLGDAAYEEGILYATTFMKKSTVLLHFLRLNDLQPACVIFIDDKLHHVQDVYAALEQEGIACIGIRFSGADPIVSAYQPHIAELQWQALPRLLSDQEAKSL